MDTTLGRPLCSLRDYKQPLRIVVCSASPGNNNSKTCGNNSMKTMAAAPQVTPHAR